MAKKRNISEPAGIVPQEYEMVPVDALQPHPDNVNQGDLGAVIESVEANKFYGAVLAQRSSGRIIAGKHRWLAAKESGLLAVPTIWLDVDDDRARRIMLADNRTTRLGMDDPAALADLLQRIQGETGTLLGTGFDGDALDELLADLNAQDATQCDPDTEAEDAIPDAPSVPVTRNGDIWSMGPHRLICGDCRDYGVIQQLFGGAMLNLAVTSPPYAEQREYDKSSGFRPIPPDEYVDWYSDVAANIQAVLADDGSYFLNIKPPAEGLDTHLYVFDLVIAHVRQWGWHFATEFCWERNGVPKSVTQRFKNQFEPVYQFAMGRWKMRPDAVRHASDNVPMAGGPGSGETSWGNKQGGKGSSSVSGSFGAAKKRKNGTSELISDVQGEAHDVGEYIGPGMAYPGNRLPTFAGSHQATGHVAAFPVGLPDFFVRAFTDEGDSVFDPFMGSGSTLIAAEKNNRVGYGCELSPAYCDVIVRRWQDYTGQQARLEDGRTFADVAAERGAVAATAA